MNHVFHILLITLLSNNSAEKVVWMVSHGRCIRLKISINLQVELQWRPRSWRPAQLAPVSSSMRILWHTNQGFMSMFRGSKSVPTVSKFWAGAWKTMSTTGLLPTLLALIGVSRAILRSKWGSVDLISWWWLGILFWMELLNCKKSEVRCDEVNLILKFILERILLR